MPPPTAATPAPAPGRVPNHFLQLHTLFPTIFIHNKHLLASDEALVSVVRDMFSAHANSDPAAPLLDPETRRTILDVVLARLVVPNAPYTAEGILFQGVPRGADETVALTPRKKEELVKAFLTTYVQGLTYLRGLRGETAAVVKVVHPTMVSPRPTCEITRGAGPHHDPQPVPILPLHSTSAQSEHFWNLLTLLWPHDLVATIREHCANEAALSNSIVMSTGCRRAWDAGEFYLLPLSATTDKVKARFRWTRPQQHHALPDYRVKPKVKYDVLGTLVYADMAEGRVVTFRAERPTDPLPDPGLLYVRAVLTKMAMSMELVLAQRMLFGVRLKDCGCEDDGAEAEMVFEREGCWAGRDNWFEEEFVHAGVFPDVWEEFAGSDFESDAEKPVLKG